MRYEKPEVVVLSDALTAIQGSGQTKDSFTVDANPPKTSPGAYEADE